MRLLALTLALAFAGPALAQEKAKESSSLVFPVASQPTPKPDPARATVLGSDQVYVFRANIKCVVVSSPEGVLNIVSEAGPIKVRAKFTDGGAKYETRAYAEKFVYCVEPAAEGRAELIIVTDAGEVVRKTIEVGKVQPKPGPDPDPKPPIPVNGFRVLFVCEKNPTTKEQALTKEQINIWNSTAIAEYLNAKCAKDEKGRPSWRRWDKDEPGTNETETMRRLWAATKGQWSTLPSLVIVSDQRGEVFPIGNMTEADVLAMLKKYGGE